MSLSIDQIICARKKTFQNAKDLIKDSELLFENNSFPRSFFISQIAVEELGKYLMLCSIMAQQINKDDIDWRKFWKRFRNHIEKRGNIYNFGIFISIETTSEEKLQQLKKLEGDLKEMESKKLSSLYTDFSDNEFTIPSSLIDKETALKSLEAAKVVLEYYLFGEELFESGDVKSLDLLKLEKLNSRLENLKKEQ